MASYFDEHNLESMSIGGKSSSSSDDVAEMADEVSSMTVEIGSVGIHTAEELREIIDEADGKDEKMVKKEEKDVKMEKKKEETEIEIKEAQLQAKRQYWGLMEVLGISREPKKCERPFSGNQQQFYELLLQSTNRLHGIEMTKVHRERVELDLHVAELEAVFILEGMKKHFADMKGGGDSKNERTPIRIWHMELESYQSISEVYFDDDEKGKLFEKMLENNDLCPYELEYVPRGEDGGIESLSFCTLRRQMLYDVFIEINAKNSLRVKLTREKKTPLVKFVTNSLQKTVKKAMRNGWGVQDLIRDIFWPYIDKMEAVIREMEEKKKEEKKGKPKE